MSDKKLNEMPTVLMALHGYHPFTPDMGAFCGGYQGILYPSPTTFAGVNELYSVETYNISPYPVRYQPNSNYDGLGFCVPSINYANPGHILSILDTVTRQACGLNVLKATRDASSDIIFNPIVDTHVPLKGVEDDGGFGDVIIDVESLSESPSSYIGEMCGTELGGWLLKDPRKIQAADIAGDSGFETGGIPGYPIEWWQRMEPELAGDAFYHNPDQKYEMENPEPITFAGLFENIYTLSYYGLPEKFVEIFDSMRSICDDFSSFKDINLLSHVSAELCEEGLDTDEIPSLECCPFPLPPDLSLNTGQIFGGDIQGKEDNMGGGSLIPPLAIINTVEKIEDDYFNKPGLIRTRYTVLSPEAAMGWLTGSTSYHKNEYDYEYRSIPELNGIINMIPIQSIGARYVVRLIRPTLEENRWEGGELDDPVVPGTMPSDFSPPCNMWVVYGITDVCLNVTVNKASTMIINMNGSLDHMDRLDPENVPDTDPPKQQEWNFDWIQRQCCVLSSVTNAYTWDRSWHSLDSHDQKTVQHESMLISAPDGPGPPIAMGVSRYEGTPENWVESVSYDKSVEIDLAPGCNNVRVRFILQTLSMQDTTINVAEDGEDGDCFWDDLVMDTTIFPPTVDGEEDGREAISTHHFEFRDPTSFQPDGGLGDIGGE